MGFFRRMTASYASEQPAVPPMGSGRRLRSDLAIADCLTTLDGLLRSYREPKYPQMPSYVPVEWVWNSPETPPSTVVSFTDADDDFLLAAFWPVGDGSELALFPLGSGDERLQGMAIIGNWKRFDGSLSSIGVVPGGTITLAAPLLPDDYLEEIVAAAGFPVAPRNVLLIGEKVAQSFLIKAIQFLSTESDAAAARFQRTHVFDGGEIDEFCQSLLDDLVASHPGMLPYVQDLPARVRAILLDAVDAPGSFWEQLSR